MGDSCGSRYKQITIWAATGLTLCCCHNPTSAGHTPPAPPPATATPAPQTPTPQAPPPAAVDQGPVSPGPFAVREQSELPKNPLGKDGKPLLPPARKRFALGRSNCSVNTVAGKPCAVTLAAEECLVFSPRSCSEFCQNYTVEKLVCSDGAWKQLSSETPACECQSVHEPLSGCSTRLVRVTPTDLSSTDGCELVERCGDDDIVTVCDGENDGTGTSQCSCHRNRKEVRLPKLLFQAEGASACFEAAALCIGEPE